MCEVASSFVLRGTFINEVMPKTPSMQRSSSEPAMAGHSSESSLDSLAFEHTYGVRLQAKYVATLEAQVSKMTTEFASSASSYESIDRTPSTASYVSNSSTICPYQRPRQMSEVSTPGSVASQSTVHGVFPSHGHPGSMTASFSSEVRFESGYTSGYTSEYKSEYKSGYKSEQTVCLTTPEGKVWEAPSVGSVGHPGLCNRPCVQFAHGTCTAGVDCTFCHMAHNGRTPHLDKRHRELLTRLSFAQQATVAVPIMRRQAAKLGLTAEVQPLLGSLEAAVGKVEWDSKTRREVSSLTSALGVLSFRSLVMAICKAADTPAWLKAEAPHKLEQIRNAATAQRARTRC